MRFKYTLTEILNDHSAADLKIIAKDMGLKGYSKKKKDELVNELHNLISDKESMKSKFLSATDKDIEKLETAIRQSVILQSESIWNRYWESLCFAFINMDDEVEIPLDIAKEYLKIKRSKRYQEERKRFSVIDQYALACTSLYAIVELSKFVDIINSQTGMNVTDEEVIGWCTMRNTFRGCSMYFYQDGYLMMDTYGDNALGVQDDYREMLAQQKDKPYYVPEQSELLKYTDSYTEENLSFREMLSFMKIQMKLSDSKAYDYCEEMQFLIRNGAAPKAVIDDCSRMGLIFANNKQLEGFIQHLMVMYNNTRIPENRGYTPNEIRQIMPDKGGISDETLTKLKTLGFLGIGADTTNNVIQFPAQNVVKTKIYPNDPCPCGSGKKYKMCCAKK